MFAPMIPMTESTRDGDETRLVQGTAHTTWHPLAALMLELDGLFAHRQERVQPEVTLRPARPIEEPAAKKRVSLTRPA
jgi:hypothetical protein